MGESLSSRVESLCVALADFDPRCHSTDACASLTETFARAEKMLAVAGARAAARAAEGGAHRSRGFAAAGDWVAAVAGSTTREARSALDTVAAMSVRPETHDAVVAGEVSLAQAAVILETAAEIPAAEQRLLQNARDGSLGFVRDQARKQRLAAADVDDLHARQHARRSVEHWRDEMGMVCGRFALAPEVGVRFVNRLEREADRAWRKSGARASRAACRADALIALTHSGAAGRSSTDLVLVCDLNAYRRRHAHDGELAHAVGGGPLPVSTIRELSKDALLKVVLHDGVEIHTVKHFGRRIRAELRTALDLGPLPELDRVECADEGCHRKYGLEWDHVDPIANGGVTSRDNLECRCRPSHRDKTERDRAAGLLVGDRAPP